MLERLKGYVQNPVFLFILWMGVGLACSLSLMMKGTYSNYVIFSQSFWHAISSSPLYVEYLQEQKDFFLYGISFTALISPFAVLPQTVGDDPLVPGELWFPLLCYQQVRFEKVAICCCYISFCK